MARRIYLLRLLSLLLFSLFSGNMHAQSAGEFVENRGQWDGGFRYRAKVHRGTAVFLETDAFTYSMAKVTHDGHKHDAASLPETVPAHAWKVQFRGAEKRVALQPQEPSAHYYNYFLGADSSRWKSGIHPSAGVLYKNLYPDIDLETGFSKAQFKYTFHLAAGADPAVIQLEYSGTDGLSIDKKGALQVKTSLGNVTETAPVAWQTASTGRKMVRCHYHISGNLVSFSFPNGYDKRLPLVIDPTVVFATFSGATADSWGFTATYDDFGNFYAGGIVNQAPGEAYPTTTGAFQATYGGGSTNAGMSNLYSTYPCDMAISKFNAAGNALIYGTYIGGTNNEQPHSMVVDSAGNLFIAGRTYSSDYPVQAGSYDNTFNGVADLVVTKLNPTGTALLGSTFIGGTGGDGVNIQATPPTGSSTLMYNYGDDARSEVIADKAGNIYVAANTQSADFPTVKASQTALSGTQDAVIFKFDNALSALEWSTYYGGSGNDAAYVLTLDTSQQFLYVGGGTNSANFPMPAGGFQSAYAGGRADGFVLRFQNSGTYPALNGSFIGRSNYDQVYGLQTDYDNKIYLMGQTLGGTFPVTPGVYSNPGSTQFIMQMDPLLQTSPVSTVIGNGVSNGPNISPVAFLVDTCGNIYLSGWGGSLFGFNPFASSMTNMPITPGAIQPTTDDQDFYFIVLSKNAGSLLYGTYRGQSGTDEHVDGGTSRFDKNGVVYQAICAGCAQTSFPTTQGAYSTTNQSARNCNLVALKIAFELGSVQAVATASPTTSGCPPLDVTFTNNSVNGVVFQWDFGDGSPVDTARNPQHTYTRPGTFTARLVASNTVACRERDTAYITIRVDSNAISGNIVAQVTNPCPPYTVSLANNVTVVGSSATYNWDFGDGVTTGARDPLTHQYADSGTYTIRLIVTNPVACNSPDTFLQTVTLGSQSVSAAFTAPDSVCLDVAGGVAFQSQTGNASGLLWDFGDGQTSTQIAPTHAYQQAGRYTVTLIADNPATCNGADTARRAITILPQPIANFDFEPIIPEPNLPIRFINLSTSADRYRWTFGDGGNSTLKDPEHFYKKSGTYKTCLTAVSNAGCLDTLCREVVADVRIAADVPTAFSPNGDGKNDVLYVRGAAIESVLFRVYNRWGQLVFETTDPQKGWDGTWNGQPQEADAYAYTLTVSFIDGTATSKNGHITLLR